MVSTAEPIYRGDGELTGRARGIGSAEFGSKEVFFLGVGTGGLVQRNPSAAQFWRSANATALHRGNISLSSSAYGLRLYRNQSPFIILLRDLSAQVLKELDRPPLAILARAENFKIFRRAVRFFRQHNPNSDRRAKHYYERTRRTFPHHLRTV